MSKSKQSKLNLQTILISALIGALVAGAAVYIWQQRELKAALAPYQKTDEQQIIEAARAYNEAQISDSTVRGEYSVREIKGNFAQVSASFTINRSPSGGTALILKKVDNHWIVIFNGQNYPPKEFGEKYGLPQAWYQS